MCKATENEFLNRTRVDRHATAKAKATRSIVWQHEIDRQMAAMFENLRNVHAHTIGFGHRFQKECTQGRRNPLIVSLLRSRPCVRQIDRCLPETDQAFRSRFTTRCRATRGMLHDRGRVLDRIINGNKGICSEVNC